MRDAGRLARSRGRVLSALPCALLILTGVASAQDPWEFWPEAMMFVKTSPGSRLYFDAAFAKGRETPTQQLDLGAYVDISIKPLRRRFRQSADWHRSRIFWARIGYVYIAKATEGTPAPGEHRGVLSFWHKFHLPADIWLEGRERVDLRWIGGKSSTRYRVRLEAIREFAAWHHPVVPYVNYEWSYDTRYDGWTRSLLQAGSEFTMNKNFRFELLFARQRDVLPSPAGLYAFGVVAKWYY